MIVVLLLLNIHPGQLTSMFFCFQLFYQIIGEIAVMTNTHEHNNKCVSNSVQTETRPSNTDRRQINGIEFQIRQHKLMNA